MESEATKEKTPPAKKSGRKRKPKKRSRSKKPVKQKPNFPVADIHLMLTRGKALSTVEPQVPLYLAAVEEYVAHEVIELAGNHALNRNSNSIDVEDVITVIREDPELNQLLGSALGV